MEHFDGKRFFNPGQPKASGLGAFLRWRFERDKSVWPKRMANRFCDTPPRRVKEENLRICWVGHSTFLIQTQGVNILTDPFWSPCAGPFGLLGPRRVHPPGIPWKVLPRIDCVLLSHNHYDHMDLPTLTRLYERDVPKVIAPLGNERFFRSIKAYNWGESMALTPNVRINIEPAIHWSSRKGWDRNRALWGSFVIQTAQAAPIYFAGDTAYGPHFRDLHAKYGPMRVAILPIGAYKPRWFMASHHMDPHEALLALKDLHTPYIIPAHYGTVKLAYDGYHEALHDLHQAAQALGIDPECLVTLEIGEHRLM